jgi:hypothetical protein
MDPPWATSTLVLDRLTTLLVLNTLFSLVPHVPQCTIFVLMSIPKNVVRDLGWRSFVGHQSLISDSEAVSGVAAVEAHTWRSGDRV